MGNDSVMLQSAVSPYTAQVEEKITFCTLYFWQ